MIIVAFTLIWLLIHQKAGAMKHKEEGYCLFTDNHVMMVRFYPCSNANCCLFMLLLNLHSGPLENIQLLFLWENCQAMWWVPSVTAMQELVGAANM